MLIREHDLVTYLQNQTFSNKLIGEVQFEASTAQVGVNTSSERGRGETVTNILIDLPRLLVSAHVGSTTVTSGLN